MSSTGKAKVSSSTPYVVDGLTRECGIVGKFVINADKQITMWGGVDHEETPKSSSSSIQFNGEIPSRELSRRTFSTNEKLQFFKVAFCSQKYLLLG